MAGDRDQTLKSVAANVRRVRQERGLTQEQLAERAELPLKTIQRIERAEQNPSVTVLASIAAGLGVEPGVLFEPATMEPIRRGRPHGT